MGLFYYFFFHISVPEAVCSRILFCCWGPDGRPGPHEKFWGAVAGKPLCTPPGMSAVNWFKVAHSVVTQQQLRAEPWDVQNTEVVRSKNIF